MPEYENEQQAAEALYSAVLEDGNARSDQQGMHERVAEIKAGENQQEATPAEGSKEGTPAESDSFTSFDPNDLPPELQGRYRDMQADYTRKTQELSESRRQYEALDQFGGAEAAMEAVQFAQSLATDPQYALQVHGQLSEALQAAGLTPEQAHAEATKQVVEAVGYDDEEADSATVQELQAVKQQLGELSKWRQQQESQQYEIQLANHMAMEERDILEAHADWGEPEMEDVYALSYSVGGNLKQAAEHYEQLQKRVLDDYLSRKASVPAGASGVSGAGSVPNAEAPQKFTDLFDPELEKMVNERLAQEIAAGNTL